MNKSKFVLIIITFFVHILLAFLFNRFSILATTHAWLTLAAGLWMAITTRDFRKICFIAAYIAGSEVLWRMTEASIFWEFGKYAILAILGLALLRQPVRKNAFLPILYITLLIISVPLTISSLGFSEAARQAISFNLSGPLSIAICVLFLSQGKLDLQDLEQIAWGITMPVVSILSIAAYSTFTSEYITFSMHSNFATSGGFGPNQVSAILGLGATMMFLVVISTPIRSHRLIAIGLMMAFLIQSALTFSRGGIYNAGICILVGALHLLKVKKGKSGVFVLLFAVALMSIYFLYPKLDQFTGGLLTDRYLSLDPTGRVDHAQGELNLWKENMLFGAGPGVSAYENEFFFGQIASAHTEYTRLLADHGIPGLVAIGLLILMTLRAYINAPGWQSKVWTAVFLAWPLVEMSHAAMRIAAISLVFGLANAVWIQSGENDADPAEGTNSKRSVRSEFQKVHSLRR